MPTAKSRDLRAADLRDRAALVRRDGWEPYENVWSSGEVAGVRAVLGEPGAVDAAVETWAPTLWGAGAADADARTGYRSTRRWFSEVANPSPDLLSETEHAQLRAARSATADLRDALDAGDAEGRRAAFGQLLQTLSNIDFDSTRDKLHIPDDAGAYRDGLIRVLRRIPPNWGRWISCSKGWYPIIIELNQQLAVIDPAYELHQVKEKFGLLRYYYSTEVEGARDRMNTLIRAAQEQAAATCELCGAPGARHSNGRGWIMTLCAACAAEKGYGRLGELVNDLGPDHRGIWKVTDYAGAESYWDMSHAEVTVDGTRHRGATVLAPPSVLRVWRLRLADGSELVSELVAAIERVR
ncbi:hypothetical protein [Mycobacteroides abscessus]|uniref:hypothetical protein n=1 Tax=Mycobacteroides abscessus TaxID=36809 RepID=UPI00031340A8|nr:hypothetical protein [Mycobacteroides abscessus]